MIARMIPGNRVDGRAASTTVADLKLALAWIGICAASCLMAVFTALWGVG